MESRAWLGIQKLNALHIALPPVPLKAAASPAMTAGRKAFSPQFFAASAPQLKGGVFQNLIYPRHSRAKEIDMTQEQQPDLRALAAAADKDGQHIYTHWRDSNAAKANQAWCQAASPEVVIGLLDRIADLEAQLAQPSREQINKWLEVHKLMTIDPDVWRAAQQERKPLADEQIRQIDDETPFHESPGWSLRFARNVLAARAKQQVSDT